MDFRAFFQRLCEKLGIPFAAHQSRKFTPAQPCPEGLEQATQIVRDELRAALKDQSRQRAKVQQYTRHPNLILEPTLMHIAA